MEMTLMTVWTLQIVAMTPEEGMAKEDYHHYRHQGVLYKVGQFEDAVLVKSTKSKRAKWISRKYPKETIRQHPPISPVGLLSQKLHKVAPNRLQRWYR